jgi:thiamine pyrophosphokinase
MGEPRVIERPLDYKVDPPTEDHTVIEPAEFGYASTSNERAALVLLNQPYSNIEIRLLWANCSLHVCADGGANQLYRYFDQEEERRQYIPEFIVGDLDSLEEEISQYYTSKGCVVIRQSSQYATDFNKAINVVQLYFHSGELQRVLRGTEFSLDNGLQELVQSNNVEDDDSIKICVLSALGGRFDQTIHSINQLYTLNSRFPKLLFYFITNVDIIFLVKKGLNYIKYPNKSVFNKSSMPICGLLPLGTEVVLNTHGLRWDVENWQSGMRGNVSSNNGITGIDGFTVSTTDDIVMNIEINQ